MSTAYILEPRPVTTLQVAGTGSLFPVRRIYCIGRNYAEHAREMGNDPQKEPPFFFGKPHDTIVPSGSVLDFPVATGDLHHEIELVVALHSGGRDLSPGSALEHVFGYAAGLDMTRRDLQAAAKKAGRPWDMAKGFDESAPIGTLQPASLIGHPESGAITLEVNGELRQRGDLLDQLWPVPAAIAYLSTLVELKAGDLLMTGTPAGVGPVQRGDRLHGNIAGIGSIEISYR